MNVRMYVIGDSIAVDIDGITSHTDNPDKLGLNVFEEKELDLIYGIVQDVFQTGQRSRSKEIRELLDFQRFEDA